MCRQFFLFAMKKLILSPSSECMEQFITSYWLKHALQTTSKAGKAGYMHWTDSIILFYYIMIWCSYIGYFCLLSAKMIIISTVYVCDHDTDIYTVTLAYNMQLRFTQPESRQWLSQQLYRVGSCTSLTIGETGLRLVLRWSSSTSYTGLPFQLAVCMLHCSSLLYIA